ncbi:MAG TPA: acetate/propionate family kinase [Steroidobacteraceae bacterium]|nr:acetate/propionate family kinase [Steroidobacteraceae bacterium]
MRVLAFNCGSSSIKCAVIGSDSGARPFELRVENIGRDAPCLTAGEMRRALAPKMDFAAAIVAVCDELRSRWAGLGKIDAVVHRVVHGGERFTAPTLIDAGVLAQLGDLERLAPLHNPPAIAAIKAARELFANVPHVAVFDTAFHATLPPRAREYALPEEIRARFSIRRYGFHGISHAHVAARVAAHLGKTPQELRVISCHLGSGASITAIEYGRSIETSMGMTPLEGLVMGSRAGDLDPGILVELTRELTPRALEDLLNKHSGLTGLTGTDDLREIERRAGDGDEGCRLAIGLYTHRIRKYIGAYVAIMGGVDAIAFTGGVGEHSALVRHRCMQRLGFLGALLDEDRNRAAHVSARAPIHDIARDDSRVRILLLRADEEAAMAADAAKLLGSLPRPETRLRIPIAVSARHAHLSQATLDRLFGPNYALQPKTALSQAGQFSAQETVRLIGPRGSLDHVRLMGPPRAQDQVEISRSDEFVLGLDAPVRISGDLANSPGVTLEGPRGRVTITGGVICARRHIHMNPRDAERFGIADCGTVSVRIDGAGRDLTFSDVSVRVAPQFTLELHLDTDEANAAEVRTGEFAELVG